MDEILRAALDPVLDDIRSTGAPHPRVEDVEGDNDPGVCSAMLWAEHTTVPGASIDAPIDGGGRVRVRALGLPDQRHSVRRDRQTVTSPPTRGSPRLVPRGLGLRHPWVFAARVDRVNRRPGSRLLAWTVDWLCILGWVVVVAAIGVPLYLAGITAGLTVVVLNVVATLVLVVPITVALAGLESSAREGTIGKRLRGLRVVSSRTGARLSYRRSLARNTIKIAVPWTIGHAAVYAIVASSAAGSVPVAVWVLTAAAYVLPIAYFASLFIGSGRTPYDRICGTVVVR